jgi:hypothetical protein
MFKLIEYLQLKFISLFKLKRGILKYIIMFFTPKIRFLYSITFRNVAHKSGTDWDSL